MLNPNNGGTNPNGLTHEITGSIFTYTGHHSDQSCHFNCLPQDPNNKIPGAAAFDFGGDPGAPSFTAADVQSISAALESCQDPAHPLNVRAEAQNYCEVGDWSDPTVTHIHGEFQGCGCLPAKTKGCDLIKKNPGAPEPEPLSKTDCSKPPKGAETFFGAACDVFDFNPPGHRTSWRQNTVSTEAACAALNDPPWTTTAWTPVTTLGSCIVNKYFENQSYTRYKIIPELPTVFVNSGVRGMRMLNNFIRQAQTLEHLGR